MSSRTSVLNKINTLYSLVEEMHSGVFRRTVALVNEAETAIALQADQAHVAEVGARAALLDGDCQQWVFSRVEQKLRGARLSQLEVIRVARVIDREKAASEYRASRVKSEQMKTVVDQSRQTEDVLNGRRAQASADDRFLSRLRWKANPVKTS